MWYPRTAAREVDFVLEGGGQLRFLEAKWTEMPSARDAGVILALDEDLRQSSLRVAPGRHAIVCRTPHRFALTPRVEALPSEDLTPTLLGDSA